MMLVSDEKGSLCASNDTMPADSIAIIATVPNKAIASPPIIAIPSPPLKPVKIEFQ